MWIFRDIIATTCCLFVAIQSSRLAAKMEKAEILEMTVEYVSQLHVARCRSLPSDVISGASKRTSPHTGQECDSSSAEYRAGFNECLIHVQRFLADWAAAAAAVNTEVAHPQLLVAHLSQFFGDSRRPKDDSQVQSSPPSPDTTLSAPPLSPSTSPVHKIRQSLPRSSVLSTDEQAASLGHHAFLFSPSDPSSLRRNQFNGDVGMPPSETQQLKDAGLLAPMTIIPPSHDSSISPSSSSTSAFVSDCTSPRRDNPAATCLQAASPGNVDPDVWRPWRSKTSTCYYSSDVNDASLAS